VFGGVHLEEVRLVRPEVSVAVEKGGKLNFADLLEGGAPEQPSQPDRKPTLIEIAHFSLDRGAIAFADRNRAHPFQARLEPLTFALDGFTTEPQKNGAYHFEARLEPSTQLAWTGSISANPPKSSGELSITGIRLSQFGSYTEDSTALRITSGTLDLRGKYVFDASRTPTVIRLEEGNLRLNGLRVDPPGRDEDLIHVDALALDGVSADVAEAQARVRSIALSGARIVARRLEDGRIELAELARPKTPPPPSSSRAWTTRLDQLRVERLGLLWEDRVPDPPAQVEVDGFELSLSQLVVPGDEVSTFATSMRIGPGGRFSAKGTARAGSGAVEAELALEKLALATFQPYAAQSITGSIARGDLDVSGRVSVSPATQAGAPPNTRFRGDVSVTGFGLLDAEGKELASFDRFALEKLDTGTLATNLGRVLLSNARVHCRVSSAGVSNLSTLSRPAKPEAKRESAPIERRGPERKINIRTIALQNFSLDFTDRSLTPPFVTRLTRFGGQITPFKQPGMVKSRIDLSGKLDGASLRVAGELRPAGKDSDADLTVTLTPWNLPPTSPYGIRFAGYPVGRGKLSLDLKYKVGQRKVDGSNVVTINQLELGDKVDSPTATSLPVKLALAILTDRSGKMEIDLPVEGSLDDPDFRVRKVVLHAIVNVLEKAATSPFALLGSLFGSSEDLSSVEFAAGSDELSDEQQKKLESLAKALTERPGLRLSIAGAMDPEADRTGMQKTQLDDALFAKARPAAPPGKDDDLPLKPAERAAGVRALYLERVVVAQEKEAVQLRSQGKPVPPELAPLQDPSAAEMETLVRQSFAVTSDDLNDLARSRAETVQDELIEAYQIDPERVFIANKPEPPRKRLAALQLE